MFLGSRTNPRNDNSIAPYLWKAVGKAFIVWIGEAVVGLIPLLGHLVVANFSKHLIVPAMCDAGMRNCEQVREGLPLAEMNVLAVVICGLGILSLFKAGFSGEHRDYTPMTYLAGIASLGLLIFSSFLYALTSAGVSEAGENVTVIILILSLAVSFYLALEEAWLRALRTFERSA